MASDPVTLTPSLEEVTQLLLAGHAGANGPSAGAGDSGDGKRGNTVPVYMSMPADLITPVVAYLRLSEGASEQKRSFLCESVETDQKIGRYSYIGADPYKIVRSGKGYDVQGDPLVSVEQELEPYRYIPNNALPKFTGGALGYIAFECVQYFEPRTARPDLADNLNIPESVFMYCDSMILFDHLFQTIKFVAHVHLPDDVWTSTEDGTSAAKEAIARLYSEASQKVQRMSDIVFSETSVPMPHQPPVAASEQAESNVGKSGYEGFVTALRKHIVKGDIIQAVPSQRLTRKTTLHPFNVYRHLRQINPSPYMFYVDTGDAQLVGASPETLCKIEDNKVAVHAIAGTVKRGQTALEDEQLAHQLATSTKDSAEHVMLVDLARNDISRVCDPATTKVETFMRVEKFSHVIHLTSRITGILRKGKNRFDALRSVFPAGTVSGAPKVRAIELITDLEKEKRGVYAGAVGHIDFDASEMDVCIAIRTMTFTHDHSQGAAQGARIAHLQAGGGIVFDSVEEEEYVETINKLGANVRCLDQAEAYWRKRQQQRPA